MVKEAFGDNLCFAFILGSFAKKTCRYHTSNASDLDTFICIKKDNLQQKNDYDVRIKKLHKDFGLVIDESYPYRLVTHEKIKGLLSPNNLKSTKVNMLGNSRQVFDTVFFTYVFTSSKVSILGQLGVNATALINNLKDNSQPFLNIWAQQICESAQNKKKVKKVYSNTWKKAISCIFSRPLLQIKQISPLFWIIQRLSREKIAQLWLK